MARIKILLIDDEADFSGIMRMRLEDWGYDVAEANTGKDAISTIKGGGVDIILLDYVMPDMDGITILKEIRKMKNKTPVIIFTAFPGMKSIKGAEGLGISAVIPKLSVYQDTKAILGSAIESIVKELRK